MSNFKERNKYFARAMTDAQVSYIEAERAVCDLEADNAKLRELCASLYDFAMSEYPDGTELNFADRLRELGVEVPDGD